MNILDAIEKAYNLGISLSSQDVSLSKEEVLAIVLKGTPFEKKLAKATTATTSSSVQFENTEQLGQTLEYAICLMCGIKYDGKFNYSEEDARNMIPHLLPFKHHFQHHIHTGKTSKEFDFTNRHTGNGISVKSNRSTYKVCPQVVGQPTEKRFKELFCYPEEVTIQDIKSDILENPVRFLESYWHNTFHCPILFYDQKGSNVSWIETLDTPEWNVEEITFTRTLEEWNESNTIKVNGVSIGEFQIHNHRKCAKFRWNFKTVLNIMSGYFKVMKVKF